MAIPYLYSNSYPQVLVKGKTPPAIEFYDLQKKENVSIKNVPDMGAVYLVDFWATWCAPCIQSIPHMNKLIQKYEDNKQVNFISNYI